MSEFLKCDEKDCDHVEVVQTITADMVGKACPKCGANLLTQADWDHYSTVFAPAMAAMKELGLIKPADHGAPGAVRIGFHEGEYTVRLPTAAPHPNADEGERK